MLVFCDTSALYAVASPKDEAHAKAAELWARLISHERYRLVTINYVVVEALSLAQRRRGLGAVRAMSEALEESVDVTFVDVALHREGLDECLRGSRGPSLVDCVGFAFMRRHGIRTAFAFDKHFRQRGFQPPSLSS